MKKIFFLIATLFLLFSCTESPETTFEKNGVSFICPKGWAITEEESIDNQGYYLSIEKDGFSSSGLIAITWIDNQIGLYEWLTLFKTELNDNIIYRNSDLTFSDPYESHFNNTATMALNFTANIIGIKHDGTIHAFYGTDKVFAVFIQEAIEDNEQNKIGFETIEESFKFN